MLLDLIFLQGLFTLSSTHSYSSTRVFTSPRWAHTCPEGSLFGIRWEPSNPNFKPPTQLVHLPQHWHPPPRLAIPTLPPLPLSRPPPQATHLPLLRQASPVHIPFHNWLPAVAQQRTSA